jgi:hypothetical protein
MQHQELMARLESTLRLGEQQNAQAFQTSFQQMQNDFTRLVNEENYSREEATRAATQAFQESMQQAGFTHEEVLQGSQLAWQSYENQMNRASQEMMSAASLAQQDSQFMAELQQRYQFNSEDLELRQQELGAQLELMGLQGDQLRGAISDQRISSAMQIVALGLEIGDGSPASMAPFVEALGTSLETYFQAQGIDISKSDFIAGLTKSTTPTGSAGTTPGTAGAVQTAKDTLSDMLERLPATVKPAEISAQLDKIGGAGYTGKEVWDSLEKAGLPGFGANMTLKSATYPKSGWEYVATPAAKDYAGFYALVAKGIPEKDAAALMMQVVGDQRFRSAYKAMTGKDWA